MSKITINGVSVDPLAQEPALRQRALLSADASRSDFILVQTRSPLTKDDRRALVAAGAEILEYVPESTYLCGFHSSDLTNLRALPFVSWANVYLDGFKISPRLRSPDGGQKTTDLLAAAPRHLTSARSAPLVDIVLHRGVDATAAVANLAQAIGIDPNELQVAGGKVRAHVQADRLTKLSEVDQVRHVEPVLERKLYNDVAGRLLGADAVHSRLELSGEGEVIAVCDTGFDTGSASDPHPAFAGRVTKLYALGRSSASDPDGHGTHVCGSALGDETSTSLGRIRGTAPKAKLVMQSVLDRRGGLGGLGDDLRPVLETPYTKDGARVHSNSWGEDSAGGYTTTAFELDDFVWKHRDLVVVVAAGNAGTDRNGNGVIDAGSVGSPGTAKNCITVGASENERPSFEYVDGATRIGSYGEGWPGDYPAEPIASDRLANDPGGLAAFSSRGPTRDGRIKPDVVAPGTAVLSARSRAPGVGNGWGPSADPLYFYEGGTSMATPLVSGCAAVVRQFFQKVYQHKPSAALVKAMLINTAKNLRGQYRPSEAGAIPNIGEGFGRVNLQAAAAPAAEADFAYWDESETLDTGEEKTFQLDVHGTGKALKVTLVWTDPPGESLQNDLDLIVVPPTGRERHGNLGTSSSFDRHNNVEQVIMSHVPAGTYVVKVRAFRVTEHSQSFALVARAG